MLDYNKQLLEKECNKIKILEIEIDYYEKELRDERDDSDTIDSIKCKLNISRRQYTISKKNREDISRTYNYLKMSIDKLKDSSSECVCPICLDDINVDNIVITKCGHKFCWDCIHEIYKTNQYNFKCPTCNTKLKGKDIYLVDELGNTNVNVDDLQQLINTIKSTKIGNIIYFLKTSVKENDKIILFSQWDELLHKVGDILSNNKFKIVYCQGSVYQRKRAIDAFKKDPDIKIIMLSSRNAASGINLTVANKIIFHIICW